MIQLIDTQFITATEKLRCDAVTSFYDLITQSRRAGKDFTLKYFGDLAVIMKNKFGWINPGDIYIERTFVDEEGEATVLKSLPDMDKVCIRNKIYHPLIINQIT